MMMQGKPLARRSILGDEMQDIFARTIHVRADHPRYPVPVEQPAELHMVRGEKSHRARRDVWDGRCRF